MLGMSLCPLIRNRNDGVKIKTGTSTALAIGAVLGGLVGKWLFEIVRNGFNNEQFLGAVQAVFLLQLQLACFCTYVIKTNYHQ